MSVEGALKKVQRALRLYNPRRFEGRLLGEMYRKGESSA
jgi:hypothetical protein